LSTNTPAAPKPSSPFKGMLFALIGFAFFSWQDTMVKLLDSYSVFQVIFFAMLFGAVPLIVVQTTRENAESLRPKNLMLVIARSAATLFGLILAFYSFTVLPMVEVYVLLFASPALISLLAIPILGEKVAAFRWFAIILGFIGVVVVLRPTVESFTIGHVSGIAAAVVLSLGAILTRLIGSTESTGTMIVFPMLANILVCGIVMCFYYVPIPLADLGLMCALGLMGLAANFSVLSAYRNAPAAFVAPMQYSQLLWAVVIGATMFDEIPDYITYIGTAIIVLSGLLIVWRETQVSKTQPTLNSREVRPAAAASLEGDDAFRDGQQR